MEPSIFADFFFVNRDIWFFQETSFLKSVFRIYFWGVLVFSKKSLFRILMFRILRGWNLWICSDKSNILIMQLNNIVGLCGVLMLLRWINCMELKTIFDCLCPCSVRLWPEKKKAKYNPMVTFTDNQFNFSFLESIPGY